MSGDYTCHADLTLCTNTDGSYQCACDVGYQGNGVECEDFNECSTDPCHADVTCANNVGSFVCTCKAGYTGDALIVLMIINAMMVLITAMPTLRVSTFQNHSNAHVTTKKTTRKM